MANYPFSLTPLPYAADSLEPVIDKATMEIHHGKHLQAYVDNLNAALKDQSEYHSWSLEKLLFNLDKLPAAIQGPVRNNGGGVYNHDFFFGLLKKGTSLKEGALKSAIDRDFGSLDELKAQLKQAGLTQFGSGWAWLVADSAGKLSVAKTPNQDTLVAENKKPVLAIDVWEHAYYLLRQNRRPEYLDNIWEAINWDAAEAAYAAAPTIDYSKA